MAKANLHPPGAGPKIRVASARSSEHPVALKVDKLPRLAEREGHRIIVGSKRIGADEAVLLANPVDFALDGARRLVLAFALERRRADDEAFVFDRVRTFSGWAAPAGRGVN